MIEKAEAKGIVAEHDTLHYRYNAADRCDLEEIEIAHIEVVEKMKLANIRHKPVDELDATLPEVLKDNVHTVYYEALGYVRVQFVSDFAHVVDRIIGKKVLDVGCGIGLGVCILANSGYEVQGLDISPAAVYYGKHRGLNIRRGDATYLPYSNQSFDTVYSIHLLENINTQLHAFKESIRVSRSKVIHIMDLPATAHRGVLEQFRELCPHTILYRTACDNVVFESYV